MSLGDLKIVLRRYQEIITAFNWQYKLSEEALV